MWCAKVFVLTNFLSFSLAFECGKPKFGVGFSVGGDYSSPGQWPWLASIHYKEKYWAGASLISKRYLLGAAHTVQNKGDEKPYSTEDFHAFLGRYDLNERRNPNSVRVEFLEILIHPDWEPYSERYDADIALFWMKSEVRFTAFIEPICLPRENNKIFDVNGVVAGYGYSGTNQPHENRPKHVEIRSVVENAVCLIHEPTFASIMSLNMFCAGMRGKNPCKGDSGGPFMVKQWDQWIVNGIVSASLARECNENDFVLFTQVPKFLGWIEEIHGGGRQLECRKWLDIDKTICFTESLKILEPNLRVTSISLHENLKFNEIEEILIIHAKFHYLPDFSLAIEKFPNFKKLSIRQSGLKELDRRKLALLPQLTELNVNFNKIQELPEDVFNDLINLEWLYIAGNQLKVLPQKLLWKLPKLKEFNAEGNQIEAIPSRFFEMNKNIEEIDMHYNKISRIEINLGSLPKLTVFDLVGNQCIDKRFREDGLRRALTDKDEFQRLINEDCRQ